MTPPAPTMIDPATTTAGSSAKLDAIFRSLRESGGGHASTSADLLPLVLLVVAVGLAYVAVTHWHRQRRTPRPLHSHKKLLAEAARSATVSRRQMARLTGLARDAGLSSPLTALICPSAIHRMAAHARDDGQRAALRAVAQSVSRQERRAAERAEAAVRRAGRPAAPTRSGVAAATTA